MFKRKKPYFSSLCWRLISKMTTAVITNKNANTEPLIWHQSCVTLSFYWWDGLFLNLHFLLTNSIESWNKKERCFHGLLRCIDSNSKEKEQGLRGKRVQDMFLDDDLFQCDYCSQNRFTTRCLLEFLMVCHILCVFCLLGKSKFLFFLFVLFVLVYLFLLLLFFLNLSVIWFLSDGRGVLFWELFHSWSLWWKVLYFILSVCDEYQGVCLIFTIAIIYS